MITDVLQVLRDRPVTSLHHCMELRFDARGMVKALAEINAIDLQHFAVTLVERFGRRGTEPNELFRSEFGHNSFKIQELSLENLKKSENFNIF